MKDVEGEMGQNIFLKKGADARQLSFRTEARIGKGKKRQKGCGALSLRVMANPHIHLCHGKALMQSNH